MSSSPWKYFSIEELKCPCGCNQLGMNAYYMQKIVKVREDLGVPMNITSGYRCKTYNQRIGGVPNSAHTKGRALDISIVGMEEADQVRLLELAIKYDVRGVGVNDKKSHFIHLDDTKPRLWSY